VSLGETGRELEILLFVDDLRAKLCRVPENDETQEKSSGEGQPNRSVPPSRQTSW
jgi:hypothetical protein